MASQYNRHSVLQRYAPQAVATMPDGQCEHGYTLAAHDLYFIPYCTGLADDGGQPVHLWLTAWHGEDEETFCDPADWTPVDGWKLKEAHDA